MTRFTLFIHVHRLCVKSKHLNSKMIGEREISEQTYKRPKTKPVTLHSLPAIDKEEPLYRKTGSEMHLNKM